jgi:hypothetical protein
LENLREAIERLEERVEALHTVDYRPRSISA